MPVAKGYYALINIDAVTMENQGDDPIVTLNNKFITATQSFYFRAREHDTSIGAFYG
jgi:hypothetical protein